MGEIPPRPAHGFHPTIWQNQRGEQLLVFPNEDAAIAWAPFAYVGAVAISTRELGSILDWYPLGLMQAIVTWLYFTGCVTLPQLAILMMISLAQRASAERSERA